MKMNRLVSLTALATAVTISQAPAQTAVPAAVQPATVDAHPALWVIRDADTTIYLFGTVHALPANISWFKGPVKRAFDAADRIVLETDMRDQQAIMTAMRSHGRAGAGEPFTARMKPADKLRYLATLKADGLPATAFDKLQPWMAGSALSALAQRKQGFDLGKGVDVTLTDAATAAGKPIGQLETIDQEFGYFDALSEPAQLQFLNGITGDADIGTAKLQEMTALWSAGRIDVLGAKMNAGMTTIPELADALIYRRNLDWAKRIKAMLGTPGTVFVSVGAGHLGGPRNLRADLAALGLKVERVAD